MDFDAVVEVVTGNTFNTAGHKLNDLPCKVCHRKVSVAITAHGCIGPLIHLTIRWLVPHLRSCLRIFSGGLFHDMIASKLSTGVNYRLQAYFLYVSSAWGRQS